MVSLPGLAHAGDPTELVTQDKRAPAIFQGTEADECQWPTVVHVGAGGTCTGTLVAPDLVVTAAHCFGSIPQASIRFGESRGSGPGITMAAEFCVTSDDWTGNVGSGDFAFCKLPQKVDLPITPIVFGCELDILTNGRAVHIVGFGNNQSGDNSSSNSDDSGAGIKRYDATVIRTTFSPGDEAIYVGRQGQEDSCSGDSGGPVMVEFPDGTWHNAGILSGGPPSCGNGPGIYMVPGARADWIEEASGVDVTPCHDATTGEWAPTPLCAGFQTDPFQAGSWTNDTCGGLPRSAASATCGEPFDTVDDTTPPTVAITSPTNGTSFPDDPSTFDINITADDVGWGIQHVAISINGQAQPNLRESPPYDFTGVTFPEGAYTLTAIATDWAGQVTESEPVGIAVGNVEPPDPTTSTTGDESSTGDDSAGDDGSADDGTTTGDSGGSSGGDADPTGDGGLSGGTGGTGGSGGFGAAEESSGCAVDRNGGSGLALLLGLMGLVALRRRD